MFNYDELIEETIPSDLRFKKLFPEDLERSRNCSYAFTECQLLDDYPGWAIDAELYEGGPEKKAFLKRIMLRSIR